MQFNSNPWDMNEERQFGNTKKILSLAATFGYKFDHPSQDDYHEKELKEYESMKMVKLIEKITETEERLYSINEEVNRMVIEKDTHDITSMAQYEHRLSKLTQLSDHLSEAVAEKDRLVEKLKTPYSSTNLQIDASLHKSVVDCFHMISPLLSNLSNLTETITWMLNNSSALNDQIDSTIAKFNRSVFNIRESTDKLKQLHDTMQTMLRESSR